MKITIGGDFCITEPFLGNDLYSDKLVNVFNESDLNIVNLECPIIDKSKHNNSEIIKTGPNLFTTNKIFPHLNALKTDLVSLANNHILDFGEDALLNTVEECEKNNIQTVGVGKDASAAAEPVIIKKQNIKIGIVNCCESEWSIAKEDRAGANPLDVIGVYNQLQEAKQKADVVLLIIHGGHEYYHYPSPRMSKQYRFFAENGADLIVAHHTHCVGGYEIHKGVPIFYSLGNMLFTLNSRREVWYDGVLLQININDKMELDWHLIPIALEKKNFQVSLTSGDKKNKLLSDINEYSETLKDSKKLQKKWEAFVKTKSHFYLEVFSNVPQINNKYFQKMLSILRLKTPLLYGKKRLALLINLIRCEAHYDLSKESLKLELRKKL